MALGQLVTSTGLGGLGKTQLAVELVHRHGRFPGRDGAGRTVATRRALARGPGYGAHLVLTANRMTEVRDALRNAIGSRLELRLNEPTESLVDTKAARVLSESGRQFEQRMEELRQLNRISQRFDKLYGRGITTGGLHFRTALPRIDGRAEVLDMQHGFEELVRAVGAGWAGPKAPPIRVLPPSIRVGELPRPRPEPAGVPIAIFEQDLGTVYLDLVGGDPHCVVVGDVECGKSTLLRAAARCSRSTRCSRSPATWASTWSSPAPRAARSRAWRSRCCAVRGSCAARACS